MSAIIWPPSLPQAPLISGYDETLPDTLLRTQMDAGAAKVRRRFTAAVSPMTCVFNMTEAQTEILDAFYNETIQGGALRFDMTHPRTATVREFRIVEPPKPKPHQAGGDCWVVTIKMEAMP